MEAIYTEKISLAQNPIFIVGFPRSGTTLLQAMLATQENICSFPETHFFSMVAKPLKTDAEGYIDNASLPPALQKIHEQMELEFSPVVVDQLARAAGARRLNIKALFELIVWQYLKNEPEAARLRWVEKTPDHVRFLDRILPLYPDARFVHILRNPIYAIYSNKRTPLSQKRSLAWLAEYWTICIAADETVRAKYPKSIYALRYEDLAQEPAKMLAEVCHFLGIRFDETRLQNYRQGSQKLMLARESWKAEVGAKEISNTNARYAVSRSDAWEVQNIAGAQMRRYGYTRLYPVSQNLYDGVVALRKDFAGLKKLAKKTVQV